jgi:ABC-type Fe3+-siderophore transport system permease subunit
MNEFSSPEFVKNIIDQMQDNIAEGFILCLKLFFSTVWLNYGPYIVWIVVILVLGILLQILLKKSDRRNQLPTGFNILVGSLVNLAFSFLVGFISYKIWGNQVIDEYWFAIFGLISFPLTWLFLRLIGFWNR